MKFKDITLSGAEMLRLESIADEVGSSVEAIAADAIRSFLAKCPPSKVPLNARARMADTLSDMVGSQSRRRAGN